MNAKTQNNRKQSGKGPTFLVGDVGGTRTRLALYDEAGKAPLVEGVFASQEYDSFEEIVEHFLHESTTPHPESAVFAVAAPIQQKRASFTNLSWKLDERVLARRFRVPSVSLVNDLVASARGCLITPPSTIVALTPARPARKELNIAVIAAGTGLGEARLIWTGERYLALPTEGGHCDFAPRTALEIELFHFLMNRFPDHVSYERVVSGAGLSTLYDFFSARAGGREPEAIARKLASGDRNAIIAELGLSRTYGPAESAVDLFTTLYGAEAGNLVLRELALGGIYVTGNIAAHIVTARRELFMRAFLQKGRFNELLSKVPVAIVTDPLVNRRGALSIARESYVSPRHRRL